MKTTFSKKISGAEALKHEIKERYGNLSNFAVKKGIRYATLHHILSGHRFPKKQMQILSEEFNTTPEKLEKELK